MAQRRGKKVADLLARRGGLGGAEAEAEAEAVDGVSMMATIKITQTGSPIRRTPDQRKTLIGLGLNKMHRTVELERHPRGARHDPQGAAYGDGRASKPYRHPSEGWDPARPAVR